jgi:hypothetical protein
MCHVSFIVIFPLCSPLTLERRASSLQTLNLMVLNKLKKRQRVNNGKPANIPDISMEKKYVTEPTKVLDNSKMETYTTGVHLGDLGLLDLTDRENDEVCI